MSKKLKAVESSIQPNHKEAELWITPTNNDGSKEVKYWNSKAQQWSKCEGEGNGGDVEAATEYYRIDWDKAIEKGWISDGKINGEIMTSVISSFEDCRIEMQGMIEYAKLKVLFVSAETQSSLIELITAITKFSFEPHSIKIYQNGSLLMEQEFNTFSDAYPGLNEQGIIFPITKEEFYAV